MAGAPRRQHWVAEGDRRRPCCWVQPSGRPAAHERASGFGGPARVGYESRHCPQREQGGAKAVWQVGVQLPRQDVWCWRAALGACTAGQAAGRMALQHQSNLNHWDQRAWHSGNMHVGIGGWVAHRRTRGRLTGFGRPATAATARGGVLSTVPPVGCPTNAGLLRRV